MSSASFSEHSHAVSNAIQRQRLWLFAIVVIGLTWGLVFEIVTGRKFELLYPVSSFHLGFIFLCSFLQIFGTGMSAIRWWRLRKTLERDCGLQNWFFSGWGGMCFGAVVLWFLIDLFGPTPARRATANWPLSVGLVTMACVGFVEPLLFRVQLFRDGCWINGGLIRWQDIESWCWIDQTTVSLKYRPASQGKTLFSWITVGLPYRIAVEESLQQHCPDRKVSSSGR